jgi:hypothetical protein
MVGTMMIGFLRRKTTTVTMTMRIWRVAAKVFEIMTHLI